MTEIFKGIEFVRISSLPQDQKEKVWTSFDRSKIIKIAKEESVLSDCILYQDYISWLDKPSSSQPPVVSRAGHTEKTSVASPIQSLFSKLAFK